MVRKRVAFVIGTVIAAIPVALDLVYMDEIGKRLGVPLGSAGRGTLLMVCIFIGFALGWSVAIEISERRR